MFFGGKFGAKRGMYVLLRWLWKWQGLVQREGQARQVISVLLQRLVETTRIGATGGASSSPTKSERDSAGLERLVE